MLRLAGRLAARYRLAMKRPTGSGPASDQPAPPPPRHASDHLANERTFLAWVRSAVAVIGLGFVVARFGLYLRQIAALGGHAVSGSAHSTIVGEAIVAFGMVMTPAALVRYLINQRRIEADSFTPSPTLAILLGGAIVAAAAVLLVLLIITT